MGLKAIIPLIVPAGVLGVVFFSTTFKVLMAWERAVILRLWQFYRLAR